MSLNLMESAWLCHLRTYCAAPNLFTKGMEQNKKQRSPVHQQVKHWSVFYVVLVINLNHNSIKAPMRKIDSNLVRTSIIPCI